VHIRLFHKSIRYFLSLFLVLGLVLLLCAPWTNPASASRVVNTAVAGLPLGAAENVPSRWTVKPPVSLEAGALDVKGRAVDC
jgi:hypothetical protein